MGDALLPAHVGKVVDRRLDLGLGSLSLHPLSNLLTSGSVQFLQSNGINIRHLYQSRRLSVPNCVPKMYFEATHVRGMCGGMCRARAVHLIVIATELASRLYAQTVQYGKTIAGAIAGAGSKWS